MAKDSGTRKIFITALKFLLTGLALYFVFSKIELAALGAELTRAHPLMLFLATLAFILSKLISAWRLNSYFRQAGLSLSEKTNLKLYWLGMYYNLFLPGGIGGDAYKIYLLNRSYHTGSRKLFGAVLLDRLSGMLAIAVLIPLLLALVQLPSETGLPAWLKYAGLPCIPLFYLLYRLGIRQYFPAFRGNLGQSNLQSMGVQLAQLLSTLLLMQALGIREHVQAYLLVFLVSSLVAVLPFTIGGVGAREVVFLFGARYFGLDQHEAVAVSLLFFLVTALVSLAGAWYSFRPVLPAGKPGKQPNGSGGERDPSQGEGQARDGV